MYIVDYIVYKSFSVDTKLGYQQKEIVSSVCVLGCIYTRTAWCSLYSYDWFIKKNIQLTCPCNLVLSVFDYITVKGKVILTHHVWLHHAAKSYSFLHHWTISLAKYSPMTLIFY